MKIIVTGGIGYIGSHTVVELINSGFSPVIVDNLSNSDLSVLEGIKEITGQEVIFEKIDLVKEADTDQYFKKHSDAAAVIHFAAYKAVGESVAQPLNYYKNNLISLINVASGMKKNQIPHLIFSSSCTVYGQQKSLPVTEASSIQPAESPYGNTKQISEEILRDEMASRDDQSAVISLRYFNPIGAHESGLIGELPIGVPNNLMPYITQTAAGIREQLLVFGDDYDTPDGTAIRDYIHVVDLAKAHVAAVQRLATFKNTNSYEVYNLGTGRGSSVLEVIQSFERSTGQKLNYKFTDRRDGDITAIYADAGHAETALGWKAELDLDAMTGSAWNWQQKLLETK